ncbi:MAG: diaminopimelate epimerase, partial [Frankiaceae bacterium]
NADGSVAEMCGNGVRVYARYLLDAGLIESGPLRLATRHGIRDVWGEAVGDLITVDMGLAETANMPVTITVGGVRRPALPVDLGNPHAVVMMEDPVGGLDLTAAPIVPRAAFPAGANVEFVNVVSPGRLRMRVIERGVGETRSCGTGACAAAVAAGPGRDWRVDVPGGQLLVRWAGNRVLLSGPAVLVAEGVLRSELFQRNAGIAPLDDSARGPDVP